MKFIQGQDRQQIQLFPVSLDASVGPDNEIRFIDLFVDSLKLNDYGFKTNFRRDNPKAIKKAFRATVEIAKNFELIGGKLLEKIERHLAYIDNKVEEYTKIPIRG